jgi:four helix bundle protein
MIFSLIRFRTYQLSVEFHGRCREYAFPAYLKNQLLRAASSVSLNLAEGCGKPSPKDRLRFYHIALGSLRESQAALDLAPREYGELKRLADELGGSLYRLCYPK